MSSVSSVTSQREAILAATVRCVDRWGVAKTTLDDVAVEAGVGRSTVYRMFPGGKAALVDAVTEYEVARFVTAFEERVSAAPDLRETLIAALALGAEALTTWPGVRELVVHRGAPEAGLSTEHSQHVMLDSLHVLFTPHLHRYLEPDVAHRVVDWATRLSLSYALIPDAALQDGLADPAAAAELVDQLFVPAIGAMQPTTPTQR